MSPFRTLLEEIHRRSLWQVLGAYAVLSWVVLQVVDQVVQQQVLPSGVYRLALGLVLAGFPVVLLTAVLQGKRRGGIPPKRGLAKFFTWRNAGVGGLGALALFGISSAIWMGMDPSGREPALVVTDTTATTIAVLPFSFQGNADYAYLGTGMVNLLGTRLDGAGDLRSIDSRSILGQFSREGIPDVDMDRAQEIAVLFGADHFVLGDIVEVGGRLQLTVRLYQANGKATPLSESAQSGSAGDVFEMVDELAAGLLAGMYGGAGERGQMIAGVTTASLPAFKAYLEGEAAFRTGHFGAAVEAFQRSVKLDSLYALAFYRLSVAAEWATQTELSQWAAEKAADGEDRLSDRDRRLLDAHLAWRRGANAEAEARYRSFVSTYPEDTEAWFQLGEVLFHANPMRGRSFTEARDAFERVVFFEPDHSAALLHLSRIAAREGKAQELESLVFSNTLGQEGDRASEQRAMLAFVSNDGERIRDLLEWLEGGSDQDVVQAAWSTLAHGFDLDGLLSLADLVAAPSRAPEVRVMGHLWKAFAFSARGELRKASAELDRAEAFDPAQTLEVRILLALAPYSFLELNELGRLRDDLESLDLRVQPSRGNPSFFFSQHDGIHQHIREYLLGLLALELGELHQARDHAAVLETLEAPPEVGTMAQDLARGIRARALRREGRPVEAYEELTREDPEIFYHFTMTSPFAGLANDRFLRAELLLELGRDDEALGWYENLVQGNPGELPFLPVTYMRRAEILRGMGDPEGEQEMYENLIDLWSDADDELRPWMSPAMERLRALSSGLQ